MVPLRWHCKFAKCPIKAVLGSLVLACATALQKRLVLRKTQMPAVIAARAILERSSARTGCRMRLEPLGYAWGRNESCAAALQSKRPFVQFFTARTQSKVWRAVHCAPGLVTLAELLGLNPVFRALTSAAASRWCVGAESTLFDSGCGVQRTARHTEDRVLTKQNRLSSIFHKFFVAQTSKVCCLPGTCLHPTHRQAFGSA